MCTSENGAPAPPAPVRRGRRWPVVVLTVVLLAGTGGGAVWYWWRGRVPQPPVVPLEGVDGQVAEVVTGELERVRREPRSVDAWGRLGKVLMANGFIPQAVQCLAVCERLDPRDPRWPYLRGLGTQREDPEQALVYFQRACQLCERSHPD